MSLSHILSRRIQKRIRAANTGDRRRRGRLQLFVVVVFTIDRRRRRRRLSCVAATLRRLASSAPGVLDLPPAQVAARTLRLCANSVRAKRRRWGIVPWDGHSKDRAHAGCISR